MKGKFKKIVSWYLKIAVIFSPLVLIAGCSETQLVIHTAKKFARERTESDQGVYKVGKPYKIGRVWYYPAVDYKYQETGIASWYGPKFHGQKTANGERFDQTRISAAHRTLPLPSMVRVTNLENGRALRVLVNDRGPFAPGRIIDVSKRAAQLLGFVNKGTAKVRVEIIADESRRLALAYGRGAGQVQIARADDGGLPSTGSPNIRPAPRIAVTSAPLSAGEDKRHGETPTQHRAANSAARSDVMKPEPDGQVVQEPVQPTRMYVQAGAFAQYENANRLRARLSVLGPTKILAVLYDKQQLFRVRVGPIASLTRADKILERTIGAGFNDARIVVDR